MKGSVAGGYVAAPAAKPDRVPKFEAIEGLRAWLAWMVVFSHIAQVTGVTWLGAGPFVTRLGHFAVLVFIIVSGFVITHLLVEKPEPYGKYILRRGMRIFPLFVVTCVIGFFTLDILAGDLVRTGWGGAADADNGFVRIAAADHANTLAHAILHLTMLHGVLGNNVLPDGAYAFNPPGWSLSLEWQFYLIAPLLIAGIRRPRYLPLVAALLIVGEIAFSGGLLGSFRNPSNFFGASAYFVIGIASRLFLPMVPTLPRPDLIAATALLLSFLGWEIAPIALWAAFLVGLIARHTEPSADSLSLRVYRTIFESRPATWAGARSYSVYLCHMTVIALAFHAWRLASPAAGRSMVFAVLCIAVPALTLALSEGLYRLVERPGIRLGSRMASALAAPRASPAVDLAEVK